MMQTILLILLGFMILAVLGLVGFTWYTARQVERRLPPRGKFLEVDGERIHVLELGTGPPILMIHGLGGQMAHFDYGLAKRLSEDHRVVLIDRPGSGYSSRARGASARLRDQAAVVAHAMERLGLEQPLVVGHSLGGAVALALALDHPQRVGGLALIAPLAYPVETAAEVLHVFAIGAPAVRSVVAWTVATPLSIRNGPATLKEVFAPDPAPADFPTRGGGLLGLRPAAFRNTSQDLMEAGLDLPGMVARYGELAVPVSVLYGRDDRILDPTIHGARLEELVPHAELTLVPGGHMLPVTIPEETAQFVRRAESRIKKNRRG